MAAKLLALLRSRRFWTAAGSIAVLFAKEKLGIDEQCAWSIVAVATSWILGDSVRPTQ